jgi:rare lipoprotein A
MRLPDNPLLPLAALLLIGMAGAALARPETPAAIAPTGPAADYPVTVGEPYTIGTTTWTPSDQLNYDAVGTASLAQGLVGVGAAHKTLPVPSYVEVTALDSGRTILARIVERGPKDNDTLVALSPAAMTQLGLAAGGRASVRVRRVNPPEIERAALRTGGTAPVRMETPESLLKVLRRKLAEQSPLLPPPSVPPAMPTSLAATPSLPGSNATKSSSTPPALSSTSKGPALASVPPATPKATQVAKPSLTSSAKPLAKSPPAPVRTSPIQPAPTQTVAASKGTHVVQVAAFSTRDRADKAARALGGAVTPTSRLWRVRLGPFAGAKDATSALEKAKAAGYRDARIQRTD